MSAIDEAKKAVAEEQRKLDEATVPRCGKCGGVQDAPMGDCSNAWHAEEFRGPRIAIGAGPPLYSDERLLWGVVRNAGRSCHPKVPRWAAVRDAVGFGSTSAKELCQRFGLDPDEMVGAEADAEGEEEAANG